MKRLIYQIRMRFLNKIHFPFRTFKALTRKKKPYKYKTLYLFQYDIEIEQGEAVWPRNVIAVIAFDIDEAKREAEHLLSVKGEILASFNPLECLFSATKVNELFVCQ